MNGSATKWISTSVAGKYEKCSNGNLSNGNHVFIKEIVNVSTMHTKVTTTKTTTTANMTLDSETGEKTVTEFSVSGVSEFTEVDRRHKDEVHCHIDSHAEKGDKGVYDSDDSDEEHNSKGLTKSFLDGLTICQYKLKCMALDQNKMNHSKVHVDESEPTGHEEAPFESRDVKIRNGCWITDEYDVSDLLLGRGKFGEVKQCKERKTGRELAAKFIEVNGPQDRFDVQNEIEMMKNLQHPRLLQLYDVFTKRNHFCLVLELISGGELFERVINDDFILTEKACIMFMRQICEGIEFMHNNSILHLDLKPENILCLTREGNRIKIIDFGLARRYKPNEDLRILFGTPEFMAPEQANFEPIFPSTDMWSIGIICYILFRGLSPFSCSEANPIANIADAQQWDSKLEEFESISAEAKDFISKLIVKDTTKRMTATECLEHKWLRRSAKRERIPTRSLSTKRLKKFVYRRKWQKAVNAMLALKRMGVKL
ncbi:myosin light chain kinase family member 4-like [Ruditapes philippinarum]|uniref:myosin light chain kinase family member 4-like n=1 Tax=Ruditapes philippinarum TaxID=129788 RepID=UPI00295C1B7A|nr:myosin light chain kinase family member 4-like [Ruditapes philippinarum]